MIVAANLYGGLGNRMFQEAAAIGYAEKHGYTFHNNTFLEYKPFDTIREEEHCYQELRQPGNWAEAAILNGYFQSEKYFEHCINKVSGYFGAPEIGSLRNKICSIHVRRGDYLKYPSKHPVVTLDYLLSAMEQMMQLADIRSFSIFSDDTLWCKTVLYQNIQQTWDGGISFEINQKANNPRLDIQNMAKCEHNIIANSTFSWWGAWLNPNPDKIIISPSKDNWFGPGNSHLDTKDIIPDSWIQIKY
jgi:hypothetical protein